MDPPTESASVRKRESLPSTPPPPSPPPAAESNGFQSVREKDVYSVEAAKAEQIQLEEREISETHASRQAKYGGYRPFILGAVALVILGWWISSTVLPATRPRWIVQTVWAWSFIFLIAFRFIPNSIISRPVKAVWSPLISEPFFKLPRKLRFSLGWLALLAIVFGSAFGFRTGDGTALGDRAISVLGLFVFQLGVYLSSKSRSSIEWQTIIVGLFLQQVIAIFVLKSSAGFEIFRWLGEFSEITFVLAD
jgi:CNT family concentrative nucleoside transporter